MEHQSANNWFNQWKTYKKQEINNNKALISRNHDLTNNEIESINGNHAKLKAAHEKLKAEVEAQNKFNSDNQVSLDTENYFDKTSENTRWKSYTNATYVTLEWKLNNFEMVFVLGQCGQGA